MRFFKEGIRADETNPEKKKEVIRTKIDDDYDFVVSQEKPFYFIAESSPNLSLAVIRKKGGEPVVDLGMLLYGPAPAPVKRVLFVKHDRFEADLLTFRVFVDFKGLKDPKNIFSVLHELGHIKSALTLRRNDPKQYAASVEARRKKEAEESKLKDKELVLKRERDAWAEAIHMARQLKQKNGLALFKLFNGREDFLAWIRVWGLRSYETSAEILGGDALTRNLEVEKWKKEHPEEWKRQLDKYSPSLAEREEFLAVKHGGKKIAELLARDSGFLANF